MSSLAHSLRGLCRYNITGRQCAGHSSEAKPLETTPAAAEAKKGAMLVMGGTLEVTSNNSRDP